MRCTQRLRLAARAGLLFCAPLTVGTVALGQGYSPACPPPYADIQKQHPMDDRRTGCPVTGRRGGAGPQQEQNKAKNNFCASGAPTTLTIDTFRQLQTGVDSTGFRYGREDDRELLPARRSDIPRPSVTVGGRRVRLGEGDPVRFVGFVINPRHSNTRRRRDGSGGESVNCNKPGCEDNDIHMELTERSVARSRNIDPCTTITAEIIPHLRPASWDHFDSPEYINFFRTHPVRLSGQLFFDASHTPCRNVGTRRQVRASPPRITVWEIHPVYSIDVCRNTSLARCAADDDSAWESLDDRLGSMAVTPGQNCRTPPRRARPRER